MTDAIVDITLGLDDAQDPVVITAAGQMTASLTDLLTAVPGLADPGAAPTLALAANHFAEGNGFAVILDPAAFETAYRARLATENRAEPWRQEVQRLCDYGVPDFKTILPPHLQDRTLVFFAEDRFSGLPFQVSAGLDGTSDYMPMDLEPIPQPE